MRTTIYYCKPKNHPFPLLSWLIRWIQKTPYSHTASECEFSTGLLDATAKGVRVNEWADFMSRYSIVEEHELDIDVSQEDWTRWCAEQASKKYAYIQNIGHILTMLKIKKLNPWGKGAARVNCSELQAMQIALGGHDIGRTDEYDLLKLDELIKKVKK